MLPPVPPSPDEMRRAMARVGSLKDVARRRRRRRRSALGGGLGAVLAAGVALAVWLAPAHRPSTVRIVSPATTVARPAPTGPVPTSAPWPSLVYHGPGVVVVGLSPLGAGYIGKPRPSQLYLSTDMAHWTVVTPPQSESPDNGAYGSFEQASFLDPSTGWVTSWNPSTIETTIYRTGDGGRTWTSVPGGGHGAHAGAASLIDLVTPTVAFEERLEPTGPGMSLSVTTDAGRTWKTVYAGPQPTAAGGRLQGPFMMPMTFIDRLHGFAAYGAPPSDPLVGAGAGDFFRTNDGGSTWQRQFPPRPDTPLACPAGENPGASTSCMYTVPVFSDSAHGVLAAVVTAGTHAYVSVDATVDGGLTWIRAAQVPVTVAVPTADSAATFGSPLFSVASPRSWWLVGWDGSQVTTRTTDDAGGHWTTNRAALPPGTPISIAGFDANHALLSIEHDGPNGSTRQVLLTADGGRSWTPLRLGG